MFTCFGEVLWDVFPNHKKIGGAPLNVALRLQSLNANVTLISAIGNDSLGKEFLKQVAPYKLNTKCIQKNTTYPTGYVDVKLDLQGSASYTIKQPVAWDFIETTHENINLVKESNVFVFGSLSCRNEVTRQTLLELLKYADFKVFDVNLRPSFYTFDLLETLMYKADFIKFNEEELTLITTKISLNTVDIKDAMQFVANTYKTDYICVTQGDKGAILLINGNFYETLGYATTVKDTVGAGDSFLATLLYQLANKTDPNDALKYACAVGALVAGKEGANPYVSNSEILMIMNQK